jgi:hypothetical protein
MGERFIAGLALIVGLGLAAGACQWGFKLEERDAGTDVQVDQETDAVEEETDVVEEEACVPTGPEVCDGRDNDCNGEVDEGFQLSMDPENCGSCRFECEAPGGVAACAEGECVVETCEEDRHNLNGSVIDGCEYECHATEVGEADGDGTCTDGADNDCDGRVDGDDPECATCVPEFCDLADNDCDTLVDEDFTTATDELNCGTCGRACPPRPHSSPVCVGGECRIVCYAGFTNADHDVTNGCEAFCVPNPGLGEYACDGIDSDCDGLVDEDYIPYACGTGLCTTDSICWDGVEECVPLPPLSEEDRICDGEDEDCDGSIDEEYVPSDLCVGHCRDTATCVATIEICGEALDSDETCDAVDDDCDGVDDEDYVPWTCGSGGCTRLSTCIAGVEDCLTGGESPEVCNLSDDDCDGTIDNGDPEDLCPPPPHANPACLAGICVIDSCRDGYYNIDHVYSNGCECAPETTEGSSTSCLAAYDLGSLADSGASVSVTGNIVPSGDVDWYSFTATDTSDTTCDHFHVLVEFTANPGGAYRMSVYKSSCGDGGPCTGESGSYEWYTDFRSGSGTTATGECPCSTSPRYGQNICSPDTRTFFVKVYRAGPTVACEDYSLRISNGL